MTTKHATWLFRGAAIYGLILLLPMYFLEKTAAAPDPAFTHPEFYYRAFMPLGVIAKLGFWLPTTLLWLNGRTPTSTFLLTNGDLILGLAFFVAWRSLKAPA